MTKQANAAEAPFNVFMLLKLAPEWMALSVAHRGTLAREQLAPVLKQHGARVSLRCFDAQFCPARITDLWIWSVADARAFHGLMQELRANPFWSRYVSVVEILAGVNEAFARDYYREVLPPWVDPAAADRGAGIMMQDVA